MYNHDCYCTPAHTTCCRDQCRSGKVIAYCGSPVRHKEYKCKPDYREPVSITVTHRTKFSKAKRHPTKMKKKTSYVMPGCSMVPGCSMMTGCSMVPGCSTMPGCSMVPGCSTMPGCSMVPGCSMMSGFPMPFLCDMYNSLPEICGPPCPDYCTMTDNQLPDHSACDITLPQGSYNHMPFPVVIPPSAPYLINGLGCNRYNECDMRCVHCNTPTLQEYSSVECDRQNIDSVSGSVHSATMYDDCTSTCNQYADELESCLVADRHIPYVQGHFETSRCQSHCHLDVQGHQDSSSSFITLDRPNPMDPVRWDNPKVRRHMRSRALSECPDYGCCPVETRQHPNRNRSRRGCVNRHHSIEPCRGILPTKEVELMEPARDARFSWSRAPPPPVPKRQTPSPSAASHVISSGLGMEDIQKLQGEFRMISRGQPTITEPDFTQCLQDSSNIPPIDTSECKQVFRTIDKDQKGYIDSADFIQAYDEYVAFINAYNKNNFREPGR